MTITAAADGSALGNPGPAGWAWFVDSDHWASGGWPHGTNNMGELMAVLDLLQQTAHLDQPLHVICDSQYVIKSLTVWLPGWKRKGWRKGDGKPVQNVELMKSLDTALVGRQVEFSWVKGHAGHELNEAADELARAAATACQSGAEPETGPGWSGAVVNHPQAQPGQVEVAEDLFSAFEEAEASAEEQVIANERELLSDQCRADPAAVAALLHPDWCEIGQSGKLWTRDDMLSTIGPLATPTTLEVIDTVRPGDDQVLLIWRSSNDHGPALRSSLWVQQQGKVSGRRWVQLFHQGTPEA